MRPPTRSTRSFRQRQPSKKVSPDVRGSPHTVSLPAPFLLEVNPQPMESNADANIGVFTSSGLSTLVSGCLPSESWPPTTFVYEHQGLVSANTHTPSANTVTTAGGPPRSRHRMTSDKLETLDAFFRRNTHPSRKEKEAICKDLDINLKTVTIWFQNKRQTVARSRKQSESISSVVPTAAIDMLASASATMIPLAAAPSVSATRLNSGSAHCSSLDNLPSSRFLHSTSSCVACSSAPKARQPLDSQPRTPLSSAAAQDPNVSESVEVRTSSSAVVTRASSASFSSPEGSELRKPRNRHWPINAEDLWEYIPSSPVQQQPCCVSDARVPPECYDKYPLDVVRGAVLLLGLKDVAHGLGV